MLIDSNLVSIDNKALAAITGDAIALTSLLKPGKAEPVFVNCVITEAAAGGTSLTVNIQQADAIDGSFATVASQTVALADLTQGARIFRVLPPSVTKPYIKFTTTVSGTFTAGKIFAAVGREDPLPYEAGMYIDKGEVIG